MASEVAARLSATVTGPDRAISGLSPLGKAGERQLAFAGDLVHYAAELEAALEAGAVVLVPADAPPPDVRAGSTIAVDNPRAAFAIAVSAFFAPVVAPGIAATAAVDPTATVDPTAHVGEFTVVGPGVVIGPGTEIRNHVVLAANVRVGSGCLIKSHAVIGEEGFGIDSDAEGNNVRLPHLGSVVLGNSIEVGNFTTVCSGTIAPTEIGDFTKIDDHVHISHNCRIGRNVIVTACAEISGSVTIGDRAWLGPNCSIIQGLTIGADSLVGIGAVVTKSVGASEVHFGNPARKIRDKAQ